MKMYDLNNAKRIAGVLKVISRYGNVVVNDGSVKVVAYDVDLTVLAPFQITDLVTAIVGKKDNFVINEVCQVLSEAAFRNEWIVKKDAEEQRQMLLKIFGSNDSDSNDDDSSDDDGNDIAMAGLADSLNEEEKDEEDWHDSFCHTRAYFSNVGYAIDKLMALPWGAIVWCKEENNKEDWADFGSEVVEHRLPYELAVKGFKVTEKRTAFVKPKIYIEWPYTVRHAKAVPEDFIKGLGLPQEALKAALTCFMSRYHTCLEYDETQKLLDIIWGLEKQAPIFDGVAFAEAIADAEPDTLEGEDQDLTSFSIRPEDAIQRMVFSHGLAAYSMRGAYTNAQKIKDSIENYSPFQICCSLQGEEVGPVGLWIRGLVYCVADRDVKSFVKHNERHCRLRYDWLVKTNFVRTKEQLDFYTPEKYHEAILRPSSIAGVWLKKGQESRYLTEAKKIAALFNKEVTII